MWVELDLHPFFGLNKTWHTCKTPHWVGPLLRISSTPWRMINGWEPPTNRKFWRKWSEPNLQGIMFQGCTWRIIPVGKCLVTPVYKQFIPFERGTTLLRGLTITIGYEPLTSVMGWSSKKLRFANKKMRTAPNFGEYDKYLKFFGCFRWVRIPWGHTVETWRWGWTLTF